MNGDKKVVVVLIAIIIILLIVFCSKVFLKDNEKEDNSNLEEKIEETSKKEQDLDIKEELQSEANDMVRETFNTMFTVYEGEKVSSATVRALFSKVETNNITNTDHIVEIDDSTGSISTADELTNSEKYNVKLHYDNEGYVCKITITEQ